MMAPSMQKWAAHRNLLPTPRATDGDKGSRTLEGAERELERGRNVDLGMAVKLWPTPHGMPQPGAKRRSGPSGNELGRAVNQAQWATPTAWLGRRPSQATGDANRWHDPDRSNELSDQVAATGEQGSLNPGWVEPLMGFPSGWTDLGSAASRESPPMSPSASSACEPSETHLCLRSPSGSDSASSTTKKGG